jgi:hypothetical protein
MSRGGPRQVVEHILNFPKNQHGTCHYSLPMKTMHLQGEHLFWVRFILSKIGHIKGISNMSKACGCLLPMTHLNLSFAQKQWSLNFQARPKKK